MDNILSTASPVANKSTKKQRYKLLGIIAAIILLILLILPSILFRSHRAGTPTVEETPVPTTPTHAPELPKITVPPQHIVKETNDDEDKLHKMRLAAPMEVAASQHDANVSPSKNNFVLGTQQGDSNTQFMHQLPQQIPTVPSTRIAHPATTIAQGTIISAIFETRVSSDLPGMVRAIVDSDVYAVDGSQLLIPKGSRLIGQYTNSIHHGQSRVFIVWQRLIRPDFVDVQLTSPGTDPLGTAGMGASHIDRHFIEQFGMSALFSLLSAGHQTNSDDENKRVSYREQLANNFAQTAEESLETHADIQPTLIIHQGTPMSVFVARDLDFSSQLN